jgi:hypothetical protein
MLSNHKHRQTSGERLMSACIMPSNRYIAETLSKNESLEHLCDDGDFWNDLIDAVNQNFVQEVESVHAHDK